MAQVKEGLTNIQEHHPSTLAKLLISSIAGGVAGLCVVSVGHPFDLIKMRLQIALTGNSNVIQSHPTMGTVVKDIWRRDGIRGLYQGASAPFLGVAPIFALNFYGYELGKRIYDHWQYGGFHLNDQQASGFNKRTAFAAVFTGLQTSIISIPADRIKVFMQVPRPHSDPIRYMNPFQIFGHLLKNGPHGGDIAKRPQSLRKGILELYRGSSVTLARDIPGLTIFFSVYEALKSRFLESAEGPRNFDGSVMKRDPLNPSHMASVVLAGGLAGISSWSVSLPFDTIKSRLQSDAAHYKSYRFPSVKIGYDLVRKEGLLALYRGWLPVFLRALPSNAACFLGYELTKHYLESYITNNKY